VRNARWLPSHDGLRRSRQASSLVTKRPSAGGFTAPKGSRKHLGAAVLGAYTHGKLRHYGYGGSGFTEKGLKDAVEKMKPLFTEKCPFVNPPNIKEKIQWVRPKLVCEVEYAELTADDQLRQTTFLGWRDDKKAKEVVLEQSQTA
jgi:bifunctional non-homologous end joining protein LigD